ncbi:uncharacterized protein [Typha angustifolia]|uniref:uncharacterized protein n=1 Tax=Typha angustifolia TaxID=59011 RepID=UPI003C2BB2D8
MEIAAEQEEEDGAVVASRLGFYEGSVRMVDSAAGEILLLWAMRQPTLQKQNAFVRHSSQTLRLDAWGHHLTILQSPSSMSTPGVTGAVMWDSGVVLGKFLEHAVDTKRLVLRGRRVVELGSGCGLVGCIASLLGAEVVLTDLPDRLKLLKKNVEANVGEGRASVSELTWGDDLDPEIAEHLPEIVLGSDVIYSEAAVKDLLITLSQLSGYDTTIFLAGELRNDVVLECFLEAAMEEFIVGSIDQTQWHPDFHSNRVALFVLMKKPAKSEQPELF